mmetsp:Transcript_40833/g.107881  ORF Transcript_40833/g.107881 Transcript_40833/m.107881 type:complete len:215 (+) Transcript_40833:387-1031(+)|eukprot:CAMPEP_0115845858 /NCGR_PEP_ID=MMETSP0287-20121206/9569_1 /TAXON_ID=412157 /ORGANISM="Chrysochromulina rotalis, Strain UIO044" /LENGTH=214 /DNA_ID=CAMNT_0003299645 /DNA_START=316 /DNA_END=960 /DNA_ORIENTATION=+
MKGPLHCERGEQGDRQVVVDEQRLVQLGEGGGERAKEDGILAKRHRCEDGTADDKTHDEHGDRTLQGFLAASPQLHHAHFTTKADANQRSTHITEDEEQDGGGGDRWRRDGDSERASKRKVAPSCELLRLMLSQDLAHRPVARHKARTVQPAKVGSPSNDRNGPAKLGAIVVSPAVSEEDLVNNRHEQARDVKRLALHLTHCPLHLLSCNTELI